MKNATILLISFLTATSCFGQTPDNYEPFKSSDYATDQYQIKLDTSKFSKFKIEIRQAKLLNNKTNSPSDFYCRGWLTVKQGDKIITEQFFKSIESVGGCSGLFISDTQPSKDCFIISKFGDYDGRIFIFDTTGKVTEKMGGIFMFLRTNIICFQATTPTFPD